MQQSASSIFLSVILGALAVSPATADILVCYFTEPFFTTTYSTTEGTLAVTDDTQQTTKTFTGVSLQYMAPGIFELWDSSKKAIQRIEMSHGYDGMSDKVYPFDAQWIDKGLRGGCKSNHLFPKNH